MNSFNPMVRNNGFVQSLTFVIFKTYASTNNIKELLLKYTSISPEKTHWCKNLKGSRDPCPLLTQCLCSVLCCMLLSTQAAMGLESSHSGPLSAGKEIEGSKFDFPGPFKPVWHLS